METEGQWCDNASCPDCGKIGAGKVQIHSYSERRFRCTTCHRTFSADKGTFFETLRTPRPILLDVVAMLVERNSLRAISRIKHLSLSRLNHWLPRIQAHPEVVQGTAEFHHQITDSLLPQADPILHDTAALDTAVDMLDPQPTLVERLVGTVLLRRQLLAAGFLGRHEDRHLGQRERQEAQILQEPAPSRQRIRGGLSNGLIMGAAAIGVTEKEDEEQRID